MRALAFRSVTTDGKTDEEVVQDLDALYDSRTKDQKRADVLVAFACRAIFGARTQTRPNVRCRRHHVRPGLLRVLSVAAARGRTDGAQRLDGAGEVGTLLDALDRSVPILKDYRDAMTHALDDKLDDLAWFGRYRGEASTGRASRVRD